jgi:hypothetical protein
MPKQTERSDMTMAMVVVVTASGGVELMTKATAVSATAPPPKHSVWLSLRTLVRDIPPFSSLSAVGATISVTATVARYGRMDRNEDLVSVTLSALDRNEGSHARRPYEK